jgi:hypothetical protein
MWKVALLSALAACGSSAAGDDDDGVDASVSPPLTAEETTTACLLYGSCMGDGINDCFTDAMPFWSTSEARCVIAAGTDCAAVRACFGMTVTPDASCTSAMTSCDGTNLVSCADGVRSTINCPSASPLLRVGVGPTCVATSTGALCGDATCSAAAATCDGTIATVCNTSKGVQMSIDCAEYAQSCVSGGCSAAGGGGSCTAGTLPRCDGSAIVRCSAGVELTTDCQTIGQAASCYAGSGTTTEPYCGFGNACYPTKGAETCSGNAVMFCAAGITATIDCTSLGFTRCFSGKCVSF